MFMYNTIDQVESQCLGQGLQLLYGPGLWHAMSLWLRRGSLSMLGIFTLVLFLDVLGVALKHGEGEQAFLGAGRVGSLHEN